VISPARSNCPMTSVHDIPADCKGEGVKGQRGKGAEG